MTAGKWASSGYLERKEGARFLLAFRRAGGGGGELAGWPPKWATHPLLKEGGGGVRACVRTGDFRTVKSNQSRKIAQRKGGEERK